MESNHTKWNLIIGLFLLVLVIGALYVFSTQIGNTSVYYILLVILSLGAALITNKLTGKITYNNKTINSSGAKAIFVFVLVSGITFQKMNSSQFGFTISLRNPKHSIMLKSEGKLALRLEDDFKQASIDENEQATFKGIPSSLKGKSVSVELLGVDKYVFKNGTTTDTIQLNNNNAEIPIFLNEKFSTVSGEVFYKNRPVDGAQVSIHNYTDLSDADGNFEIRIPNSDQLYGQEEFDVRAQKDTLSRSLRIHILNRPRIILENNRP